MIVSTTYDVAGFDITEHKGLVRGVIVRAPTIMQGFFGTVKSVMGGTICAYSEMCDQARQAALELLEKHAQALGANAVVGFRYSGSDVGGQTPSTEVIAYGTAVVVIARSTGR